MPLHNNLDYYTGALTNKTDVRVAKQAMNKALKEALKPNPNPEKLSELYDELKSAQSDISRHLDDMESINSDKLPGLQKEQLMNLKSNMDEALVSIEQKLKALKKK